MRTGKRNSRAAANAVCVVMSAVLGFAAVFVGILLFSFVMTKIDLSDSVLSVVTSAALCIGAFTGGYAASRRRRKNGLLMGLVCALFMFAVIFLLSYFFAGTFGSFSASPKLVMTLSFGSLGGIVGVNSKGRRYPR